MFIEVSSAATTAYRTETKGTDAKLSYTRSTYRFLCLFPSIVVITIFHDYRHDLVRFFAPSHRVNVGDRLASRIRLASSADAGQWRRVCGRRQQGS